MGKFPKDSNYSARFFIKNEAAPLVKETASAKYPFSVV
jgi:hypothetical protein